MVVPLLTQGQLRNGKITEFIWETYSIAMPIVVERSGSPPLGCQSAYRPSANFVIALSRPFAYRRQSPPVPFALPETALLQRTVSFVQGEIIGTDLACYSFGCITVTRSEDDF
jgi:hypothetical protein